MSASSEAAAWARGLATDQFRHLLDHLPGTLFFAKDDQYRLMMGNPAFVERCGLRLEKDLVGLTDDMIFPPSLAQKYRRDDERVLQTGRPLLGQIELFPNAAGSPEWFVTDKLPLLRPSGEVGGLCGTVRSYESKRAALQPYLDMAPAAEHLKQHFRETLNVAELADLVGLSVRQLGRKFLATFQTTPRSYQMKMRVMHACELLTDTDKRITDIALESGFYDHSDFARQFGKHMGQTASAFRAAARRR